MILFLIFITLFGFSNRTEFIKMSYDGDLVDVEIIKGQAILEIDDSKREEVIEELKKHGYQRVENIYKNFYVAIHRNEYSFNVLNSYKVSGVKKIYPNRVFKRLYIPNDSFFNNQYYLYKINAPQAWDFEDYKTNITLALIDSGLSPSNPDFYGIVYTTQVVVYEDSNANVSVFEEYLPAFNMSSGFPHGTAVAGIVAALRDNIKGISGISKAKIFSFDVFRGDNLSEVGLSVALINVKNRLSILPGKVIVNMSLGALSECSSLISNVINDLYNYDSGSKFIIVAAAGNDGLSYISMPANCQNVVPVTATDESDKLAYFSNYGSRMKINGVSAPGVNIFTTLPGESWGSSWGSSSVSGTSFSAPIVSAVMGAVWAKRPDLKNWQVVDIVKKTAKDIDENGPDKRYGWGIVDMYKALSYLEADLSEKGINENLIAWPNPFYISKHGLIKFSINVDIIYPDDKLMIFDFSGAFIAWAKKDGLKGFIWDGKNSQGIYVAPGAYIAYYKSERGTAKTKFVLFR